MDDDQRQPRGKVRVATPSDAPAIARIYTASALAADSTMDTDPVSANDVLRWFDAMKSSESLFVYEEGPDILGWGICRRYSDRPGYAPAAETSLYLDREHLGRGIGTLLQRRLMDWCRTAGFHHVVAKIWADNEASIALHRRFGFTLVGVQDQIGFVAGKWRDVAIMQCLIEP